MIGAVISRGLTLVAMILVARMLGKTGYGELGMIRSTVGMFAVFAGFGLGLTATKHIAEFRQSDPERAGRILGMSGMVALLTSGIMALGLFVFAPWLAEHTIDAPHLAGVLRVGALILLIDALNGAQTGALSGFEAFKTIAYVSCWSGALSFPVLVAGAYFGQLTGAVWALVITAGLNWLLNHLALRKEARRYKVPFTYRHCAREFSILWTFSTPAVISGMMVGPTIWGCKSILANQPGGYAALGALVVAESWRIIPMVACQLISGVSFPIMSQLYGQGQKRQFRKTLYSQFYLNGGIALLSAVGVSILAKPILACYGPEFADNTFVLILVVLSTVPMQLTTVVGVANRCIGNIWWSVLLNALWAVVYLLATWLLVGYGALGLAWATLIAYMVQLVAAAVYILWALGGASKLGGEVVS